VPLAAGLTILLLLLAAAGWYLFNLGKQSNPAVIAVTRDSLTKGFMENGAEETPLEIPEGIPEEDAPGTRTPSFTDNFDDGLAPVWSVIYGQPLIADGQLTSKIGAGIAAGDASWENYQIDFDVDTSQVDCSFVDTSNSIGVRVTDYDHAYWFVFTNCNAAWSLFAGGVPDLLPNTMVNTSKETKHISIKVDETKMSAYEDGTLLSSITDTRFHTGGIFLQVETQTYYDNFQVNLLP
jgi:hypothetical protein